MGTAARREVTLSLILLIVCTFTGAASQNVKADATAVSVTVQQSGLSPNAAGAVLTIDGTGYTLSQLPQTFSWNVGDTHTLSANSPIGCSAGCQNVWTGWSDGAAQTHSITVGASGGTYIAGFKTQYYLTLVGNPNNPAYAMFVPGSGWQDAGTMVQIMVIPSLGHTFAGWATINIPVGGYQGQDNPAQVTMNGPIMETAFIGSLKTVQVTVDSTPEGVGYVSVDGFQVPTPLTFSWVVGDKHMVVATASVNGYNWTSWSDGGALSHTITVPTTPTTYSAVFTTTMQTVQVTVDSNPEVSGLLKVDGMYITTPRTYSWAVGTQHLLYASPSMVQAAGGPQYLFTSWSDGGSAQHAVTVQQAATYTASFEVQYYLTNEAGDGGAASPPSGWYDAGTQVTIQATPSNGYLFAGWTGLGTDSYGGTSALTTITMNGPVTETANFQQAQPSQVEIIVTSAPGGAGFVTVDGAPVSTPQTYAWTVGDTHTLAATPPAGYKFASWSDGGGQTHTITVPSSPATYTASFQSPPTVATVTLQANGLRSDAAGAVLNIDGTSYTYAQLPTTFTWDVGSTHTLSATAQVNGSLGVRYVWSSWSDGGAQTHGYTANANSTVTAVFNRQQNPPPIQQVQVTVDSSPEGPGYVTVDGASVSTPQTYTWAVGDSHTLAALTPSGYSFASWSDGGGQTHAITVPTVAITYTANFNQVQPPPPAQAQVTIDSSPEGSGYVTVDGAPVVTPQTYSWAVGDSHTLAAIASTVYSFTSWSDGGQQTHTITVSSSATKYTASFVQAQAPPTQYQLVTSTSPAEGGSVALDPVGGTYDSGQQVQATPIPSPGYQFVGWALDGSPAGSSAQITITMNQAHTLTADFQTATPAAASITFQASGVVGSDAVGAVMSIDGAEYYPAQLPQTFSWQPGSVHQISATELLTSAASSQDTEYTFASWTGTNLQTASGSYTTPSSSTTVTAVYCTRYLLTMQSNPTAGGATNPGDGNWYRQGDQVQISATATGGYSFASWTGTGTGSYDGSTDPATITVQEPITETANFQQAQAKSAQVTVEASGLGVDATGAVISIDNVDYPYSQLPRSFTWTIGSAHTISAASVDGTIGTRYAFQSWSDGGAQSHSITATSAVTVTANFKQQYYLTLSAGDGGTISPLSGWQDSGARVQIEATPDSNQQFLSWTGTGGGSYSGTDSQAQVTMNGPVAEAAAFAATNIAITIDSSPEGAGFVKVDGVTVATPHSFDWDAGSQHTIAAASPVPGDTGVQYEFTGWSDGGAQSHTVTAPSSPTVYTAAFNRQYYLTVSADAGGTVTPGSGWQDAGAVVAIQASPDTDYAFSGWAGSGAGSYAGAANPANITMNKAITETAGFTYTIVQVTVASSTPGAGYVTVDGTGIATPHNFTWAIGSKHSIAASSQVSCGSGCQYVFTGWSDSGDQTHSVIVPQTATTYDANYETRYYLTMQTGNGVTATPASGWYTAKTRVQLHAAATAGYTFQGWTGSGAGSYTGPAASATVTLNGPVTEIAVFGLDQADITISTNVGTVGAVVVDGTPIDTPQQFNWTLGSVHTICANAIINGAQGTRYVWQSWSDGGDQNHTITVRADGTYTASYKTQYLLTIQAGAGGTVNATGGWGDSGATVLMRAAPNTGYVFASWTGTGDGSYSGANAAASVTVRGPISETASFTAAVFKTVIESNPAGSGFVTIDGTQATTPATFSWAFGATHRIAATGTVQGAAGTQYIWTSWSDNKPQSFTITVTGNATYTAAFETQYALSTQAAPSTGGSVTPANGWYDSGTAIKLTASPATNYLFQGWAGTGTGSYTGTANPATVTIAGPVSETAAFAQPTANITVTSTPAGQGFVTVDGTPTATPTTFNWVQGSTHTLAAASLVSGQAGARYAWAAWSDGGSQAHTITISGKAAYTATFQTQYLMTMQSTPAGGGAATPPTSWYNPGSQVKMTATPSANNKFLSWTGAGTGSYTGTANSVTVTVNAPMTETANFQIQVQVNVTSMPTGSGYVFVDGAPITTPRTLAWMSGTTHTIAATAAVSCGSGCQYALQSWSDGGAASHTITVPFVGTTYTATYQKYSYVTMQATKGGAVSPASGWYQTGSAMTITATPNSGYLFQSWTGTGDGSYSGTAATVKVSPTGAISEKANFVIQLVTIKIASNPAGSSYVTVDGITIVTPKSFTWQVGAAHTIAANSPVSCGAGCQYVSQSWSDGGAKSHTINTPAAATTYTATFQKQYYLTVSTGTGGGATPSSGWYNSGATVQLHATPRAGYTFSGWKGSGAGSYTGPATTITLTMNGAITETAIFLKTKA